jgi:hypothetical protein
MGKSTCDTVRVLNVNADKLRCDFEKNLPFNFRCRAAMQAVPSSWPDPAVAVRESPEPSKKQMRIVFQVRACRRIIADMFQRCTLAVNISETLLFLHRPFFASAIHECSSDPTRSARGQSYLAIVERCNVCHVPTFSVEYESNRGADRATGDHPGREQPFQPVPSRGDSALVFLGEWDHFPPSDPC